MIEAILRENLLRLARIYAQARQWNLASVSRDIHGDPPFFDELARQEKGGKRRGRAGSFTARKYDEMMSLFSQKFAAHDLTWPKLRDIPNTRPKP